MDWGRESVDERDLFLDTNIYLHAQPFGQIPWPEVAGVDTVVVLAPQVTIGELDDKKKSGRTKRIRARAQKTTIQIVDLIEGDGIVREAVQLEECYKRPCVDFDELGLDKDENDDVLLATILTYQEEHPERDVALVTNDAGPRLKARRLGVSVLSLPDKYMLEPELSEIEKKLREAKAEAARAKAAQPELELSFSDGSERLMLKSPVGSPTEEEIAQRIEEHRRRYSLKNVHPSALVGGLMGIFSPQPDEIERYKKQLPSFLDEWEEWYRSEVERKALKNRSFELSLQLSNSGRSPANDTKVVLTFPAGTTVTDDPEFLDKQPEPEPPVKPRSSIQMMQEQTTFRVPSFMSSTPVGPMITEPSRFVRDPGPDIEEREDQTAVALYAGKVQQGDSPCELNQLVVIPPKPDSFGIEYTIVCDELHEPTEGSLHVVYQDAQ